MIMPMGMTVNMIMFMNVIVRMNAGFATTATAGRTHGFAPRKVKRPSPGEEEGPWIRGSTLRRQQQYATSCNSRAADPQ